ncbi:MAG: aldo/keto reductase [Candidatus Latescibacteria bacterium]|nr:aldo/keto reductase [Candidatus Latescibacterota bacterium]
MKICTLGRTGLQVTQLGFGAMEIRGPRVWGGRPVTDAQAETILNTVLDAGITFIDTANDYGLSEERIGRFISRRRDEYYLATKCGCLLKDAGDHDETPHIWTHDNLLRGINESLARMKTDYVDVLQLHNPSVEQVEQNGLVEALKEIQASGKTRFIGISSTIPHIATFIKMGVFDTFQIPYSALDRAEEDNMTKAAMAESGTIIRGGIASGATSAEKQSGRRWAAWQKAKLDDLLNGMSRTEFILRFTLTHPHLHTTIVGTLNPAHLADNLKAAAEGPLPADIYAAAKRRLTEAGERPAPA